MLSGVFKQGEFQPKHLFLSALDHFAPLKTYHHLFQHLTFWDSVSGRVRSQEEARLNESHTKMMFSGTSVQWNISQPQKRMK